MRLYPRHAGYLLLATALVFAWMFLHAAPVRAALVNAAMIPAAFDADWAALADQADDPRVQLLAVAESYAALDQVPYVWGGNKFGDAKACASCRKCLRSKKRTKLERRHRGCTQCQACGIDCSHFVNRVYEDAGLAYPYASTSMLRRLPSGDTKLVAVGRDLEQAQPGDLLLYPTHVVMLLQKTGEDRGDFIHVSRSTHRDRLGGIEIVRGRDLSRFRGKLVSILRHESLHGRDQSPMVSSHAKPWSPIN